MCIVCKVSTVFRVSTLIKTLILCFSHRINSINEFATLAAIALTSLVLTSEQTRDAVFLLTPPRACGRLHSWLMKLLFVSSAVLSAPGTAFFYTSAAGLWAREWAWGQSRLSTLHTTSSLPRFKGVCAWALWFTVLHYTDDMFDT